MGGVSGRERAMPSSPPAKISRVHVRPYRASLAPDQLPCPPSTSCDIPDEPDLALASARQETGGDKHPNGQSSLARRQSSLPPYVGLSPTAHQPDPYRRCPSCHPRRQTPRPVADLLTSYKGAEEKGPIADQTDLLIPCSFSSPPYSTIQTLFPPWPKTASRTRPRSTFQSSPLATT